MFTINRFLQVQIVDFPTSVSLTHLWGLGSVLGTFFGAQAMSGLLISFNYVGHDSVAFLSIINLITEAPFGWLVYTVHSVGAGAVFFLMYSHMSKFLLIRSFSMFAILSGSLILLLTIVSSFLGYVLLWQQMSYWAATVITTLLSVFPDGNELLTVLWGNFTLDSVALTRFYSFHYLATLITSALAIAHLIFLHLLGSTSGAMVKDSLDNLPFARYYLIKDMVLFSLVYLAYVNLLYVNPTIQSDSELAISINTMSTPPHIVPEWYLLSYYATLRGIPSKLFGIIMVVLVILSLFTSVIPAQGTNWANLLRQVATPAFAVKWLGRSVDVSAQAV